jgi:hypothetical protein
MGKYSPLKEFLLGQTQDSIPMTFAEIEKLLAFKLPASKQYPAWWSNNPSNNPMTREWLDAGYETESVNTASGKLVFRRMRKQLWGGRGADTPHTPRGRHPGFGFMKGLIKVEEGFDVTRPFDDEPWDKGFLGSNDSR